MYFYARVNKIVFRQSDVRRLAEVRDFGRLQLSLFTKVK